MHIETVLQKLGYPTSQVKIYLESLKMGEATIAEIAEQAEIARTTVTELVNEMHKHGLINFYARRGRKYWTAENPDKLMTIIKEREAALKTILPQLHAMAFDSGEGKPNVRCYIGLEEVKTMFDDMIETKHHIKAVVSWNDFKEFFGQDFVYDLIERRYSHFLKMRLITPKTESSLRLRQRDVKEMRQTRFLPENIELRRTSTFIYENKVTLISLNRKQPTSILIHDPDVAHGQTLYFESLWNHCS